MKSGIFYSPEDIDRRMKTQDMNEKKIFARTVFSIEFVFRIFMKHFQNSVSKQKNPI